MPKIVNLNNLSKYTEILKEKINARIQEPLIEGKAGDVLSIDENGDRIWRTYIEKTYEDYTEEDILDIFENARFLYEDGDILILEDDQYLLLES